VDKTSNKFGFITFEDSFGGRCYWYDDDGPSPQDQIEQYWDFLGTDFQLSRIFAAIAAGGGWLQFFYSVTFCCSSQVRSIRYFQFFLVSIVLTLFQGLSLVIFSGDFCQEHDCVFGRAAGFACAACGCYFVAGIMYCIMSDYPGARFIGSPTVEEGDKDVVVDEEQPQEQAPQVEDGIVFEESDDQPDADTMDNNGEEGDAQSDCTPITRGTQSEKVEDEDAQSDSTPIARGTHSETVEDGNEVPVEQEVEDGNEVPVEQEVEEEVEEEIEVEVEEEVLEEEEEIIEEIVEDDTSRSPQTAEDVIAADDSSHDPIFFEEE
jgi:hypothetical protein